MMSNIFPSFLKTYYFITTEVKILFCFGFYSEVKKAVVKAAFVKLKF